MSGFTEFVPTAALRNRASRWFAGLTQLFHTYRSVTVRGSASSSNSQNNGLTGHPSDSHLVRETCLAATLPQGLPQESRPPFWEGDGLSYDPPPSYAALRLAADRDLDLLVYARPS